MCVTCCLGSPVVRAVLMSPVIGVFGKSITLQFNITKDNPLVIPGNIKWQFNGTNLVGGDRVVFSDNRFSVTLSNLSLSDEGIYTVTASNPAGSDMDSLFLDVEGKIIYYQYLLASFSLLQFLQLFLKVLQTLTLYEDVMLPLYVMLTQNLRI